MKKIINLIKNLLNSKPKQSKYNNVEKNVMDTIKEYDKGHR